MAIQVNHDINSGTLDSGEVANLLRTMQAAQFKKSEKIVEKDNSFKPRSLVDIAFDAEERRKQALAKIEAENAQKAAEQAEADALAQPASAPSEQTSQQSADNAPASDEHPQAAPSQTAQPEPASSEPPTITQSQSDEMLAQLRAELEANAQAELQALEAKLSEEHYHRGFEAGQEAARTAEPTEEEKAHQAHQEAEKNAIIQRFEAAINAASQMDSIDVSEIQQAIDYAVKRLAGERAGYAIAENPEGMIARISDLADNIASQARVMDVYLNPDDKHAIEKWLDAEAHDHDWSLHGAPELVSGDIRIVAGGIELTDLLHKDELPEGYFAPKQSAPEQPADIETGAETLAEPTPQTEMEMQAEPENLASQDEPVQPEQTQPEELQQAADQEMGQQAQAELAQPEAEHIEDSQPEQLAPVSEQPAQVPEQPAPEAAPAEEVMFAPPASEGEGEFGFPPQSAGPDSSLATEIGEMEFAPPASEGEGEFGFPMGGSTVPTDDEAS